MRATRLLPILLSGALALACGETGAGEEGPVEETLEEIDETTGVDTLRDPGAENRPQRVRVRATSFAYEPSAITVGAGSVRFVVSNAADVVHGFEVEGHGLEAAIEAIPAGATDSLTVEFETPGEYEVYCPVGDHRSRGMTGTVSVE